MGKRYPNYRLAKRHRNYTVEEIAKLFDKHENTVRAWLKNGLDTIDNMRPILVHGHTLARFLEARRTAGKRPCPPGHLYCLKCRAPMPPTEGVVTVDRISEKLSKLAGVCPACGGTMHGRAGYRRLEQFSVDSG